MSAAEFCCYDAAAKGGCDCAEPTMDDDVRVLTAGVNRTVILIGRWAFKLPAVHHWRKWRGIPVPTKHCWYFLLRGLLSNSQEREFWTLRWSELCPVVAHLPGGFLIVMRRARPLTDGEWAAFDHRTFTTRGGSATTNYDAYRTWLRSSGMCFGALRCMAPDCGFVPVENKRDSFGVLDGRIVAVDYG